MHLRRKNAVTYRNMMNNPGYILDAAYDCLNAHFECVSNGAAGQYRVPSSP